MGSGPTGGILRGATPYNRINRNGLMTDLSPTAQAVLDAANGANSYGPDDCLNESRWIAAAALRAAAKVIDAIEPEAGEELLAIAAELDQFGSVTSD